VVEERGGGRLNRVVTTVSGAAKARVWRPDEWPCDDPADIQGVDQFARDLAYTVQAIEAENVLMRGDLKYAVRGRIADRLLGLQVLCAKLGNDFGAAGVTVPENARQVSALAQVGYKLRRKAGNRTREVAPLEKHRNTRKLPMTGRRILSFGHLAGAAKNPDWCAMIVEAGRNAAARKPTGLAEPKLHQVRQGQWSSPAGVIRETTRAGVGDVADRVSAFVPVKLRIGC
jgi:hypothetical protein